MVKGKSYKASSATLTSRPGFLMMHMIQANSEYFHNLLIAVKIYALFVSSEGRDLHSAITESRLMSPLLAAAPPLGTAPRLTVKRLP